MAQETTENPLADLDPVFSAPIGAKPGITTDTTTTTTGTTTASAKPAAKDEVSPGTAAAIGAGVGVLAPKMEVPSQTPGLTQARANAPAAKQAADTALSRAQQLQASHAASLADVQTRLQAAQQTHSAAMDRYNALRDLAAKTGLPADIAPGLEASGDKWSRKVVGSMGPGGEGMTEAARNYQMQKGLTPEESSKFRVGRSGIIEPNTGIPASAVDKSAILRELQAAEKAALEASQELARHQGMLDSLTKKGPISQQMATSIANKEAKAAEAAARLKELEKIAKGNMLARIFGKIPGVAAGAMSGYELAEAYNALQKGDVSGAILPGMAGVGGALSLVPHPLTKAAGFALSLPPLAYQAYQAYQGGQKPAAGGSLPAGQTAPLPPMQ